MGNTTSKGKGIYFFVDPLEESQKRKALFLGAQAKARNRFKKKKTQIPEIFMKEISPESIQTRLQAKKPEQTFLTCYNVMSGKEYRIWQQLLLLTTSLRVEPSSRILAPEPRLVLHLRGDFDNPRNNGILSVLFATKRASAKSCYGCSHERSVMHLFEPDRQLPDFASVLQELVQEGMLRPSLWHFDSDTIDSLQILILLWAKANFQGIDPIGGEETIKELEGVEWRIYERITQPRMAALELYTRYGDALAMLLSLLRLWHYLN